MAPGHGRRRTHGYARPVSTLRLFAQARVAAGTGADRIDVGAGATVGDVLDAAVDRYGAEFARILPACAVWLNGEVAERSQQVAEADEVAVLPPVSGGHG